MVAGTDAARRGRGARARDRHHRAAQRAGDRHRDRGDRRPVSARLQPAARLAAPRQRPGEGEEAGRGRSPRPPPCPYSRRSPSSISSSPSIRSITGTTRSRRGPGWRWSAHGRPPRWRSPSSCCAGRAHEPHRPGRSAALSAGPGLDAEWTKFRTVAGPSWLLAGVFALTIAVGAAAASVVRCQSATCGIDPATVSLTGIYPAQAVAAVAGVWPSATSTAPG